MAKKAYNEYGVTKDCRPSSNKTELRLVTEK